MPLIIIAIAILILVVLVSIFKFNTFLSLIFTAFIVGLMTQMELLKILQSITNGIGSTMGSIALIIVLGAMLGKLIEESGSAYQIVNSFIKKFGVKRMQLATVLIGFMVGLPMFYNAAFLVLIPLVYMLVVTTDRPLVFVGLPLCAALLITHGFLPPHPAPTFIAQIYQANIGKTLLYGIIVAIPAIIISGPLLSNFYRKMVVKLPEHLFVNRDFSNAKLPSLSISILTILCPVILMLFGTTIDMFCSSLPELQKFFKFFCDPSVALFLSVCLGIYTLGVRQAKKTSEIMSKLSEAVSSIAMILLIIAAGGAFKQVLVDSGINEYVKQIASGLNFSPLILAWCVAGLFRLAMGSATVACITAAGLVMPLIKTTGASPELMVIATGAGSLSVSHFNDSGFWMFKEYFNLTIKQTFTTWTLMGMVISLSGLAGVLILNYFI
jgi:Gnt-I system high-affinity gluconate transporter